MTPETNIAKNLELKLCNNSVPWVTNKFPNTNYLIHECII